MLRFIPNILTFGRLVLTVIFLIMVLFCGGVENKTSFLTIAFVLFVVAGITDILDGKVARKLRVTSKFGRMLDPLVDKILVCGAFVTFALIGEPKLFGLAKMPLAIIHWAVAAILISREVYVTTLRHIAEAKGINFAATASGKFKMFLQSFAIGTVIIKMAYVPLATWGYWFTTVVYAAMIVSTVISGIRATQRKSWKNCVESADDSDVS